MNQFERKLRFHTEIQNFLLIFICRCKLYLHLQGANKPLLPETHHYWTYVWNLAFSRMLYYMQSFQLLFFILPVRKAYKCLGNRSEKDLLEVVAFLATIDNILLILKLSPNFSPRVLKFQNWIYLWFVLFKKKFLREPDLI